MALVTGFLAPLLLLLLLQPAPQRQLLNYHAPFPSLDLETVSVPHWGCSVMNYITHKHTHQSPLHKHTQTGNFRFLYSTNQWFPWDLYKHAKMRHVRRLDVGWSSLPVYGRGYTGLLKYTLIDKHKSIILTLKMHLFSQFWFLNKLDNESQIIRDICGHCQWPVVIMTAGSGQDCYLQYSDIRAHTWAQKAQKTHLRKKQQSCFCIYTTRTTSVTHENMHTVLQH